MCPAGTLVQILHKPQELMSETGHAPESFPARTMFNITDWESQKVQNKCPAQASEVATYAAKVQPDCRCLCGPGSEKTWTKNEDRPSYQFGDGEWVKLAPRMIGELLTSKHPVFKCSNIFQTGAFDEVKGMTNEFGNHFKNEPDNHRMLVNTGCLASFEPLGSLQKGLWEFEGSTSKNGAPEMGPFFLSVCNTPRSKHEFVKLRKS